MRQISLPLRVCLGLPSSVHRSSLFSEFGVFDMRLLHHVFAVSFARRCFLLPYNHPSHELMLLRRRQRRSNPTPFARSRVPFCVVLERSEAVLKLKHHSSTKSGLHRAALAHQHDELNASAYGALFQSVKRSPGISQYIRSELRPAARNRARLRLDRARLNVVLHRQGAVPSPNCSTCPGVAESVSHVMLSCPAYAAGRAACQLALSRLGVSFSLRRVLGSVDGLRPFVAKSMLKATSLFIQSVSVIRRF